MGNLSEYNNTKYVKGISIRSDLIERLVTLHLLCDGDKNLDSLIMFYELNPTGINNTVGMMLSLSGYSNSDIAKAFKSLADDDMFWADIEDYLEETKTVH